MAITDWPLGERPREKLLGKGAESLSDAELVAIFLRTGVKVKSAVDLAREVRREPSSGTGLCRAPAAAAATARDANVPRRKCDRGDRGLPGTAAASAATPAPGR